jgi:hypothetical protein
MQAPTPKKKPHRTRKASKAATGKKRKPRVIKLRGIALINYERERADRCRRTNEEFDKLSAEDCIDVMLRQCDRPAARSGRQSEGVARPVLG